jgi:hypothetical protein
MKYIRLTSILIAILAVLIISIPASAASTTLTYDKVNGIEISAGSFDEINTNGATFTAMATNTKTYHSGFLIASVNYEGTVPMGPDGSNKIVGGTWSLSSFQGTISGAITGGKILWYDYDGMKYTGIGAANINLSITKGTGKFSSVKSGGGTFEGCDVHASGVYVKLGNTKIQVPIIKVFPGTPYNQTGLTLSY